jgi:hypothetical protein
MDTFVRVKMLAEYSIVVEAQDPYNLFSTFPEPEQGKFFLIG